MSCYISSNENRFYAGLESSYGNVASVTSANRFSAVSLTARQKTDVAVRKDKTGSRTYMGLAAMPRKKTDFEVKTYMTGWAGGTTGPAYGPLFQGALGATPITNGAGTVDVVTSGSHLHFTTPHQLTIGQALRFGGEIRFVSAIADPRSIVVNAPFTVPPTSGAAMGTAITYRPATDTPSVSIFDYWDPSAVQRVISGAAVNKLKINVNADYHEFTFSGGAQDLIDNASFSAGQGALSAFPPEPVLSEFNYSVIPGHLGQVWLGTSPNQFLTLTKADIELDNGMDLRAREFGSATPRCIAPGQRSVTMNFSLYEQDDAATQGLYQAARQRSPISVMFQLGQQAGQLAGIHIPNVIPELPEFDDSEVRLQWKFSASRAQGTVDDEIYVAFA